MHGQHIVTAHVFDVQEFILRRHLRQRDDLDAVLFPVRAVHKQITEVAGALCAFHGTADIVHVLLALHRVCHVHDETRMAAIEVILAAEQRSRFVQQRRRDGRQVARQDVNLLIDVRLHQVKHAALRKLIRLRVNAVVRVPVRIQVKAAPGELRQRRLQLQRVTEATGPLLKIGIAKNQVIQRKAAERLLT